MTETGLQILPPNVLKSPSENEYYVTNFTKDSNPTSNVPTDSSGTNTVENATINRDKSPPEMTEHATSEKKPLSENGSTCEMPKLALLEDINNPTPTQERTGGKISSGLLPNPSGTQNPQIPLVNGDRMNNDRTPTNLKTTQSSRDESAANVTDVTPEAAENKDKGEMVSASISRSNSTDRTLLDKDQSVEPKQETQSVPPCSSTVPGYEFPIVHLAPDENEQDDHDQPTVDPPSFTFNPPVDNSVIPNNDDPPPPEFDSNRKADC